MTKKCTKCGKEITIKASLLGNKINECPKCFGEDFIKSSDEAMAETLSQSGGDANG